MLVRVADENDIVAIEVLMHRHWLEKKEEKHPDAQHYDQIECTKGIGLSIFSDLNLLVVAENDDGVIIGYSLITQVKPIYTKKTFSMEQYIFVHPRYRHTRAFAELRKATITASKAAGCDFLQVANLSTNERLERAYEKRYTKVGSVFHIKV